MLQMAMPNHALKSFRVRPGASVAQSAVAVPKSLKLKALHVPKLRPFLFPIWLTRSPKMLGPPRVIHMYCSENQKPGDLVLEGLLSGAWGPPLGGFKSPKP